MIQVWGFYTSGVEVKQERLPTRHGSVSLAQCEAAMFVACCVREQIVNSRRRAV